jgi:phosphoenolpyruvate carboxylase
MITSVIETLAAKVDRLKAEKRQREEEADNQRRNAQINQGNAVMAERSGLRYDLQRKLAVEKEIVERINRLQQSIQLQPRSEAERADVEKLQAARYASEVAPLIESLAACQKELRSLIKQVARFDKPFLGELGLIED